MLALALTNGAGAEGLLGGPGGEAPGLPPVAPAETTPAMPILPGSPSAVVRPFYDHVGLELDPKERRNFIDPAKTVLDKAEALQTSGQGDCLDPNMALDNADYDKAEIDKSLRTQEAVKGDEAKVIVAFVVAGNPHRLEWKLTRVDGTWKISDLLSVTGEWALSQYQCD